MKYTSAILASLFGAATALGTFDPTHYCKITSTANDNSQGQLMGIGQFSYDSAAKVFFYKIVHGFDASNKLLLTNSLPGQTAAGNFSFAVPQGLANQSNPVVGSTYIGDNPQFQQYLEQGHLAVYVQGASSIAGRCNILNKHQQEVALYSNATYTAPYTVSLNTSGVFLSNINTTFSGNSATSATGLSSSSPSSSYNAPSAFVQWDEETQMVGFNINTFNSSAILNDVYLTCGNIVCWSNTTNLSVITGSAFCPSFASGNCSFQAYVNSTGIYDSSANAFNSSNLNWWGSIRSTAVFTSIFSYIENNSTLFGAALLKSDTWNSIDISADLDVLLPAHPRSVSINPGTLNQVGLFQTQALISGNDLANSSYNLFYNFTNGYFARSLRLEMSGIPQINGFLSAQQLVFTVETMENRTLKGAFEPLKEENTDSWYTHTCFLIPSQNYTAATVSPFSGAGVFSYNPTTSMLSFALIHTLEAAGQGSFYIGYPGQIGQRILDLTNSSSPIIGSFYVPPSIALALERDNLYLSFPGIQNGARCQIVGKDSQEVSLSTTLAPLVAPGLAPTSAPTTAPVAGGAIGTTAVPTATAGPLTPTLLPTLPVIPTNSTNSTGSSNSTTGIASGTGILPTATPTTGARRRLLQMMSTAGVDMSMFSSGALAGADSSTGSAEPTTATPTTTTPTTTTPTTIAPTTITATTTTPTTSAATTSVVPTTEAVSTSEVPTTAATTTMVPTTAATTTAASTTTDAATTTSVPTTSVDTTTTTPTTSMVPTTSPSTDAVVVTVAPTAAPEAEYSGCLLRFNRMNNKLWYICNTVVSAGQVSQIVLQDANNNQVQALAVSNGNSNGTLTLTPAQAADYLSGRWTFSMNGQVSQANKMVSYAAVQTTLADNVIANFTAPIAYTQRLSLLPFVSGSFEDSENSFYSSPLFIPVKPVHSLSVALFWNGVNTTTSPPAASTSSYTASAKPTISSLVFANFQPMEAHLHGPAHEGMTAGVIIPITVNNQTATSTKTWVGAMNSTVESEAFLYELELTLVYENLHTLNWPMGEVRGQLYPIHKAICPKAQAWRF